MRQILCSISPDKHPETCQGLPASDDPVCKKSVNLKTHDPSLTCGWENMVHWNIAISLPLLMNIVSAQIDLLPDPNLVKPIPETPVTQLPQLLPDPTTTQPPDDVTGRSLLPSDISPHAAITKTGELLAQMSDQLKSMNTKLDSMAQSFPLELDIVNQTVIAVSQQILDLDHRFSVVVKVFDWTVIHGLYIAAAIIALPVFLILLMFCIICKMYQSSKRGCSCDHRYDGFALTSL